LHKQAKKRQGGDSKTLSPAIAAIKWQKKKKNPKTCQNHFIKELKSKKKFTTIREMCKKETAGRWREHSSILTYSCHSSFPSEVESMATAHVPGSACST
jgi:hypothetical protein